MNGLGLDLKSVVEAMEGLLSHPGGADYQGAGLHLYQEDLRDFPDSGLLLLDAVDDVGTTSL